MLLFAWGGCAGPDEQDKDEPANDTAETAPDTAMESGESDSGGESAGESDTETDTAPKPEDNDGDGWDETVDCDDWDPWTWPGAQELCDQVDQDCDGQPLAKGVCGEVQPLLALAEQISTTNTSPRGLSDMTGDGAADLLVSGPTDWPLPNGGKGVAYGFYRGEYPLESLYAPTEGAALVLAVGGGGCLWVSPMEIGDTEGDGVADLFSVAQDCQQGIYVHSGPLPTDGRSIWMDDTDTWWTAPMYNPHDWMNVYAYGGDLDGDGRDDFVGVEQISSSDIETPAFDVFFGGEWGDVQVRVDAADGQGTRYLQLLDDVTGDGLSEVAAVLPCGPEGENSWCFIEGADLRTADGALAEDLTFASTPARPDDPVGDVSAVGPQVLDDLSGDGFPEVIFTAGNSETLGYEHGEVFVFEAPLASTFAMDDALGSWVGTEESGPFALDRQVDTDGDGRREFVLRTASGQAEYEYDTWVNRLDLPALRTPIQGLRMRGLVSPISGGTDLSRDGRGDVTFFLYNEAHDEIVGGYMWKGWEIPWDDPQYW